jgi:hypothetical protein
MSTTATRTTRQPEAYRLGRLAIAGLLAAVAAAIANLLVFFVARELLDISFVIPYEGSDSTPEPLPAAMVIIASAIPALIAAMLLGLLARWARRSLRIFQAVAVVALLLSLGGPLTLDDVATSTRVALIVMHLVAAALIVGILSMAVRGWPRAVAAARQSGRRGTARSGTP